MRSLFQFLCVAGCVFLLAACDGPTVFMAGGKLDGTVTEVPDEWRFAEDSGLAQLETRPAEPYSINLAYVQLEGNLYAYAGDTRTNWVEHIEADPLVRIRINDAIYPLRAVRVEDPVEMEKFAESWSSRSMFQRDPRQFDEVWLYRLVDRA